MAVRYGRGDVKQTTTGFRGPLMVQSLTSAKSKFLSLQALKYWNSKEISPKSLEKKLKLIYGRLTEVEELVSIEEVMNHERFSQNPWLEWRDRNIKEYAECEIVLNELPEQIDVLFLDGGQFSTREEFKKLKHRTKIVLLDDTTTYKTESIREEIASEYESWEIVLDSIYDRHGIFIACRHEYSKLLV